MGNDTTSVEKVANCGVYVTKAGSEVVLGGEGMENVSVFVADYAVAATSRGQIDIEAENVKITSDNGVALHALSNSMDDADTYGTVNVKGDNIVINGQPKNARCNTC